jgi:hypothetical protein
VPTSANRRSLLRAERREVHLPTRARSSSASRGRGPHNLLVSLRSNGLALKSTARSKPPWAFELVSRLNAMSSTVNVGTSAHLPGQQAPPRTCVTWNQPGRADLSRHRSPSLEGSRVCLRLASPRGIARPSAPPTNSSPRRRTRHRFGPAPTPTRERSGRPTARTARDLNPNQVPQRVRTN